MAKKTAEERFLTYVDKTDTCWIWTGSKNRAGYGQLSQTRILGPVLAHRYSYELHIGPIPAGIHVLHNCPGGDNPACVNPSHLWLGTDQDNTDDKMKKGRCPIGEKHYNHRLTTAQINEIRQKAANSVSQKQLATEFNVSQGHISSIVNQKKRRTA